MVEIGSKRVGTVAAVLAATALLVSACGSDSEGEKKASASPSAVDPAKVSPTDLPEIPQLKGSKGAIADATFEECSVKAGSTTVKGSVTNGGKETATYAVAVSWINDTSDVLARGVASVKDVAPAASEKFAVEAEVPAGVKECTFYVVRGTGTKADSAAR